MMAASSAAVASVARRSIRCSATAYMRRRHINPNESRTFSSSSYCAQDIRSNERLSRKVNARGANFHVEQLNPNASRQVLCLAGSLGTASTDFSVQLDNGGLGGSSDDSSTNPQFGLVAIDPRGLAGSTISSSGKKALLTREYPPDFYLQDALDGAAVMSALGYEKYSVLGWSDGANAAIHLAAHADTKDSIDKLVVWGGNAYVTEEDIDGYEAVRDVSANWSERMRNDKADVHGGVEALQALNDKYTDTMRDIMYKRGGDICLSELHRITCPTMVLHGSKDVICHERHARYIGRHIPNAQLRILPEGKHNLHMRHANEFRALVRDFLLHEDVDEESQPDIDHIAYGFMGSKALFSALRAGVFDIIDAATEGSKPGLYASFEVIESSCDGIRGERLRTLLSACVALRLIRRRIDESGSDTFRLPKASADQLCKRSRRYWGDYLSNQVDSQFYTRLADIDNTMRTGTQASHGYESWFESDPDAAALYTKAQHNGSLATAFALHKRLPELKANFPSMRMLDVGGGSGAFSIATVRKIPDATAVVLDLPNVIETAKGIIFKEEESVRKRVSTLALSATDPGEWEMVVDMESFDVVLMSYVSGSIPSDALQALYQNAFRALRPGGMVVIHDFFVDNDGNGPTNAALWALAHVTVNPEGMGLVPRRIVNMLGKQGFIAPRVYDLIPGMTQIIVAKKQSV
jgi:pimeloyl-ACP methyl ester carboxylesterase/SAM-dependent methyltransferase